MLFFGFDSRRKIVPKNPVITGYFGCFRLAPSPRARPSLRRQAPEKSRPKSSKLKLCNHEVDFRIGFRRRLRGFSDTRKIPILNTSGTATGIGNFPVLVAI
jgi:hypothetical protein